jgi:hypothetical protein
MAFCRCSRTPTLSTLSDGRLSSCPACDPVSSGTEPGAATPPGNVFMAIDGVVDGMQGAKRAAAGRVSRGDWPRPGPDHTVEHDPGASLMWLSGGEGPDVQKRGVSPCAVTNR